MSWWLDAKTWEEAGKIAPVATAGIALVAATIALCALRVQWGLACKRAAFDFFLKTEMDKSMVDAIHAYEDSLKKFEEHRDVNALLT